jgi:DNA polymerase (family 10)
MKLPGIGRSLANAIDHLAWSHRLPLLERLRGEQVPERMFATVPNIGKALAKRIHDHLGIETLAELEAAAHDGRLAQVPGMGNKRIQAVRESLAGRFRPRWRRPGEAQGDQDQVPVEEVLDVDGEYRRLAAQGRLPRISPRRFNPTGEAWLPVLHTQRGTRHYTALFSNTARAHELGTTHDWVVIYRDDDDHGRWTVITAQYGRLRGHRIIRGREQECARHYATAALPTPTGHAMAT